MSAPGTEDRCTIGTCGPAACTSVCRPSYDVATSATTSAAWAGSVTSSWYAAPRTPQPRTESTTASAASGAGPVGDRDVAAAAGEHPGDGQADAAAAADDQRAADTSREVLRRHPSTRSTGQRRRVKSRGVQPVAPSGSTSCSTLVCTVPSLSVARTRTRWSPASTVGGAGPLHPGVLVGHEREVGGRPSRRRPPRTRPRRSRCAATRRRRRTRPRPPSTSSPERGTSTRDDIFTGPSSPQPRSVQYAEMSSNVDTSMSHDPLGGRDVAVEPGHDRAHREAVVDRQRPAVHRQREHRVAVVGQGGQRRAARPAVVGGLQYGVRAGQRRRPRRGSGRAGPRSTTRCRSGRRRPRC